MAACGILPKRHGRSAEARPHTRSAIATGDRAELMKIRALVLIRRKEEIVHWVHRVHKVHRVR
jgi:hypothetical protein